MPHKTNYRITKCRGTIYWEQMQDTSQIIALLEKNNVNLYIAHDILTQIRQKDCRVECVP